MKKADLLANKPPGRLTAKNVIGNMFYVNKEPVVEMQWILNGNRIRHFTWKDHWLTYRDTTKFAPAHWTRERKYQTGDIIRTCQRKERKRQNV